MHLNVRRPGEFQVQSKVVYDLAYKKKLDHERKISPRGIDQSDADLLSYEMEVDCGNSSSSSLKKLTKGKFMQDKNMLRIVKGSAELRQSEFNKLLDRNESVKKELEKRKMQDIKK